MRSHSITCISAETAYALQKELAEIFCSDSMKVELSA